METLNTGTDELLARLDARVATITLNRPAKRNALSDRLTPALRQVLLDLEQRDDVGCVVITGSGTAFCAGGDVSGMQEDIPPDGEGAPQNPAAKLKQLIHRQETLTLRLHQLAKPTIAVLPGVAAEAECGTGVRLCVAGGAQCACCEVGGRTVAELALWTLLTTLAWSNAARACRAH